MTDTKIVNWIRSHLLDINTPAIGDVVVTWSANGKRRKTKGYNLRNAIEKAIRETDVSGTTNNE